MVNPSPAAVAEKDALVRAFTLSDLHLIGKHMLAMADEDLLAEGCTPREVANGNVLFEKIDHALSACLGGEWPDMEVL